METRRSLEELRLSRGMSVSAVGAGRNGLIDAEKGRHRPGVRLIRRLAEAYGCTCDDIFTAWEESRRRYEAEQQQVPL